jgi:hypothetical protein
LLQVVVVVAHVMLAQIQAELTAALVEEQVEY